MSIIDTIILLFPFSLLLKHDSGGCSWLCFFFKKEVHSGKSCALLNRNIICLIVHIGGKHRGRPDWWASFGFTTYFQRLLGVELRICILITPAHLSKTGMRTVFIIFRELLVSQLLHACVYIHIYTHRCTHTYMHFYTYQGSSQLDVTNNSHVHTWVSKPFPIRIYLYLLITFNGVHS